MTPKRSSPSDTNPFAPPNTELLDGLKESTRDETVRATAVQRIIRWRNGRTFCDQLAGLQMVKT